MSRRLVIERGKVPIRSGYLTHRPVVCGSCGMTTPVPASLVGAHRCSRCGGLTRVTRRA